jgi:hypothetical protein
MGVVTGMPVDDVAECQRLVAPPFLEQSRPNLSTLQLTRIRVNRVSDAAHA